MDNLFSTSCDVVMTSASAVVSYEPFGGGEHIQSPQNHAWEGAEPGREHGGNWMTSNLSPDGDLELDREKVNQRSRYIYRNVAGGGAVDKRKDLVVGTGFTPEAMIEPVNRRGVVITQNQADTYNEELEEVYEEWNPHAGVTGNDTLLESCRLIEGHHCFDGESITILSDIYNPDSPIPFAIEVVNPTRMSTPPEKTGDPNCVMGVQYDARRARILGYWIQDQDPGDLRSPGLTWTYYDASRIVHVFEKMFAGQTRGLAWMARALLQMVNGKDLEEAGIIQAQVQTCYTHYITQKSGLGLNPQQAAERDANRKRARRILEKDITPGTRVFLGEDQEMVSAPPPNGMTAVESLLKLNDRRIATALNMAYEMLANDWSGVSFAGGRIILSGCKLDTESRQERIATRWCRPIWHWMVDEAVLFRLTSIPAYLYNKRPFYYRRHLWIPQAWQFSISPGEEIEAKLKAVNGNITTKSQVAAEYNGGKWKRVSKLRMLEVKAEKAGEIVPPDVLQAQGQNRSPQAVERENEKVAS